MCVICKLAGQSTRTMTKLFLFLVAFTLTVLTVEPPSAQRGSRLRPSDDSRPIVKRTSQTPSDCAPVDCPLGAISSAYALCQTTPPDSQGCSSVACDPIACFEDDDCEPSFLCNAFTASPTFNKCEPDPCANVIDECPFGMCPLSGDNCVSSVADSNGCPVSVCTSDPCVTIPNGCPSGVCSNPNSICHTLPSTPTGCPVSLCTPNGR